MCGTLLWRQRIFRVCGLYVHTSKFQLCDRLSGAVTITCKLLNQMNQMLYFSLKVMLIDLDTVVEMILRLHFPVGSR